MKKKCRRLIFPKIVYAILFPFAGLYFVLRYRVRFQIPDDVKSIKGSFILMGNHVNKWDPFVAAVGLKRFVSFIASDYVFRKPFLAWLLRNLGAVPKVKFRSDMGSLRSLMDLRSCGEVIGVFPEGHTNWSGKTMQITASTGKLLRLLRAPVVGLRIKGGYISEPRWHRGILAPGMIFEFFTLFSIEDVRTLSVPQLNARLQMALEHNEWDYLREHPRQLPSKQRARGLEHAVFICPDCKTVGAMRSDNNKLYCDSCSSSLEVQPSGFPGNSKFTTKFGDIAQWDEWQQDQLFTMISDGNADVIFEDEPARFAYAPDGKHFTRFTSWGKLQFTSASIRLVNEERVEYAIPALSGIAVQNSEQVEFYINNTLTTVEFQNDSVSPYKWFSALNLAQSLMGDAE